MSNIHSTIKRRSFQHLTTYQRGKIQALLEQKLPKAQIARQIGIPRSTLYEELKRGTVKQKISNRLQVLQKRYGNSLHEVFKTVTSDNGSEFSGLIVRRFIPKGEDIGKVPSYVIQKAEDFINDLPRKMFGYRTPRELFNEQIALLSQS